MDFGRLSHQFYCLRSASRPALHFGGGSARGNALGDAVVGRADDPSAIFYDPAGITQLPGIQVMGGVRRILTGGTVETPLRKSVDYQ